MERGRQQTAVQGHANRHGKRGSLNKRQRISKKSQDASLDDLVDILLAGTHSFLLKSGVTGDQLARSIRAAANRIQQGSAVRARRSANYKMMLKVGDVIHDWCWDPQYVDSTTSEPRNLTLDAGGINLRQLILRRVPGRPVHSVVSWMESHGVITRQLDGSFAVTRRIVLADNHPPLALERVATLANQYLETGLRNAHMSDPDGANPDRIARVFNLPEKYIPQFRKLVREQTQSFLDTVDHWLESRNAPGEGSTAEAGVHAWAYTGPIKSKRRP